MRRRGGRGKKQTKWGGGAGGKTIEMTRRRRGRRREDNRILRPENLYKCATFYLFSFSQSTVCSWGVDMSWFCSVCEKSFSRKDNMQTHMMSKHRNAGLTPFQTAPMFSQKCQRFRLIRFTSIIAGMTGSGKTAWVRSLLQQASETIYPPPERIVWCYSQCYLRIQKC